MADNDNKRRFGRPQRARAVDPGPDGAAAPQPDWAQPGRPAHEQAHQDVVDVAGFLSKVDRARAQGRSVPKPQPMREVLGAFHSSPRDQTRVQVLAAAATARHLEGAQSANAQRWERLARENADRLEALRRQQHHREQVAYQAARMSPEQIRQRDAQRSASETDSDKRAFDAAAAIALGYVAARGLPPFDRLAALSAEHLDVPAPEPTFEVDEEPTTDVQADSSTSPDLEQGPAADDAVDVSANLEPMATPEPGGASAPNKLGPELERAGRGLASAIGATHGDDEVAPNLSPVHLPQLTDELLGALRAAQLGHPRSVTEMLNIEREPDQYNEAAFVPDMGVGREHSMTADI